MKSDFYMAITQIAAERGIPRDAVMSSVEHALKTVYRRTVGASETEDNIDVEIDPATGGVRIFVNYIVAEEVVDPSWQLSLEEARQFDPDAHYGKQYRRDRTPKDFGRIAAQTAKQVVLQRIRDFERDSVYDEFADRVGEVLNGVIQRADSRAVIVELGKAEAVMPVREQVPNERYRPGQRLKVYLLDVNKDPRGPQLIVSRTNVNLVKRLFELEVPEIFSGAVEIMAIAREPGLRSKVAVAARQEKVDPVGSCVGIRGVRIQNIVNELMGEKIDVIEWSSETTTFISNALSPAKPVSVGLNEEEKVARVIVPSDQMSLAIGKDGQNARLAYKLTGWRIDVKDPESLKDQDRDLLAEARAALSGVGPEDFMLLGRQPRLVRVDGTFSVREREFGPLPDDLIGMSIDVEVVDGKVSVYYARDLRARYDFESGKELPLYDDAVAGSE